MQIRLHPRQTCWKLLGNRLAEKFRGLPIANLGLFSIIKLANRMSSPSVNSMATTVVHW